MRNYIKFAWRALGKNKGTTTVNILGLATGLSLCLVLYFIISFELSFDNFHLDKNRVYRIVTTFKNSTGVNQYLAMVPDPMSPLIRKSFTGVETVAQFHNLYAKVSVTNGSDEPKRFDAAKDRKEPSDIIIADPQYFNIFSYQWLAGSSASLNNPQNVVLTLDKARKYFGNIPFSAMLGRQVVYADSLTCIVSGIVKDLPTNSDLLFKDFISAATIKHSFLQKDINLDEWQNWASKSQTFVKLSAGTNPKQFTQQAGPLIKTYMDQGPGTKVIIALQPLADRLPNFKGRSCKPGNKP